MKKRLQLRQRVGRAWANLKRLLRTGWSSISPEDRRAIARSLFVLAIVIAIGGLGLSVLSFRPKRKIETHLSCKSVKSSVPFRMIMHYGTREVRLWEFAGKADDGDRDSIDPKPATQLPDRFVTLLFTRSNADQTPWLEIVTAPSEGRLDLGMPPHSAISVAGQPSGFSMDIKIQAVNGGPTNLRWQVGKQVTISAKGVNSRPVDIARDGSLKVSPIKHSQITFDLTADKPNAAITINAERDVQAFVLRPNDPAALMDLEVQQCAGYVLLDNQSKIDIAESASSNFKIEAATAKEFRMKLVDSTPMLAIDNASGMANEILVGGLNLNPRLYEDIWSKGLVGSGLFGIVVIGFAYVLGVAGKKAIDVLADIVIPDAEKPENPQQSPNRELILRETIGQEKQDSGAPTGGQK